MRPKTETKSKSLSVRAALTLLLMLFATTSARAKDYNYISDLKLIGGTQAEVAALKTTYTEAGWEVIDQNLNEGAGGDYIYLLYKPGSTASANQTFVTKLYISTNKDDDSFRSDDGSFTWSLVPYDGGTSFKSSKGNLNNGVGTYDPNTGGTISVGDRIHLYYTKQLAATQNENKVSLTSITINNMSDGALGKNGNDAAAYSLNNGTTGNSIYIHYTTARTPEWVVEKSSDGGRCRLKAFNKDDRGVVSDDIKAIPAIIDGAIVEEIYDDFSFTQFPNLETVFFHEAISISEMPSVKELGNLKHIHIVDNNGTITHPDELPASITSIPSQTFSYCSSLTSVNLPANLTSIGNSAFESCSSLQDVNLPANLTVIGASAFVNCSSLTSVIIPASVTGIWGIPFAGCSSLETIKVQDGNTVYDSRNDCNALIVKESNLLINGCKNTVIPNSVTAIGAKAFYGCSSLTSVTIPNSVTTIGDYAFYYCSSLASVTISNGVKTIGDAAFEGCSSLASVSIPNSVTTIGGGSFNGCSSLLSVTIPNGVTTIGGGTFYGCSSLTSVTIPNGVTTIWDNAFEQCSSLLSITIPNSVETICEYAFSGCSSLQDLYFNGTKAQWDAVEKGENWNEGVSASYKEYWRCTVTFDANGHGTAPAAQENLWRLKAKVTEPADVLSATGYAFTGWYKDAAGTQPWDFANDLVPDDMTLYAGWTDRLCAATTTAATTIEIPYGQEWTDIPVTVSSLTLSWFQNTGKTSRQADMMKLTPYVGSATTSDFTFYQVGGSDNISAYKGAGEHTVGNSVSEALTATGQSGTLWVHIPQSVWESAAVGTYESDMPYDAVFYCNAVFPAETYDYSLGTSAKVTLRLTITDPVTLQFDKNGGTGDAMDNISTRKGVATVLPACTYSAPDGQSFICWNTKADGTGERYAAGDAIKVSANTTLYAQWGEEYVIDLSTTDTEVDIPFALLHQLYSLRGYFSFDDEGLDLNLDGQTDVRLSEDYNFGSGTYTDKVVKLAGATLLTQNYRFLLTLSGEPGEYGSVLFLVNNKATTVQQPAVVVFRDTENNALALEALNGETRNVLLDQRTLKAGKWNTLCLPFSLTAAQIAATFPAGTEIKTLSGYSVSGSTVTVSFAKENAIEANKPYIVHIPDGDNIYNPLFRDVTISYDDYALGSHQVVAGDATFIGTYDVVNLAADRFHLFLQDNKLYYPSADVTIRPFRAFFVLGSGLPDEARSIEIDFGEGETTHISLTPVPSPTGEGSEYYDLQGRRVKTPSKGGIYIHNGMKVAIK